MVKRVMKCPLTTGLIAIEKIIQLDGETLDGVADFSVNNLDVFVFCYVHQIKIQQVDQLDIICPNIPKYKLKIQFQFYSVNVKAETSNQYLVLSYALVNNHCSWYKPSVDRVMRHYNKRRTYFEL